VCKNWVFLRLDALGIVNVRPTMLDEHRAFRPFIEIFTSRKLPWATTSAVHRGAARLTWHMQANEGAYRPHPDRALPSGARAIKTLMTCLMLVKPSAAAAAFANDDRKLTSYQPTQTSSRLTGNIRSCQGQRPEVDAEILAARSGNRAKRSNIL
jgi:hypothetical protein